MVGPHESAPVTPEKELSRGRGGRRRVGRGGEGVGSKQGCS